jgi:hypothetical protein
MAIMIESHATHGVLAHYKGSRDKQKANRVDFVTFLAFPAPFPDAFNISEIGKYRRRLVDGIHDHFQEL